MAILTFQFVLYILLVLCLRADASEGARFRRQQKDTANDAINSSRRQVQLQVTALVLVQGRPGLLTEPQFALLEELFVEVYNELADTFCIGQHEAVSAAIDRSVATETTRRQFGLAYLVNMIGDDSLFYTQNYLGEDLCPGLSEERFLESYNQAIQTQSAELASSIDFVSSIIEMISAPCRNDTDTFMPNVIVSFTGNPSLASPEQLTNLEQAFQQTYNALNTFNPNTCDPFFRNVEQVSLIEENGFNRRVLNKEQRHLQATAITFSYLFRIRGACRGGCSSSSSLFDHETSRRLDWTPKDNGRIDWRRLQVDIGCICPLGATEERAPTQQEFQSAFQAAISALQNENRIDSSFIQSILDTREVNQVECGATQVFETNVRVELSGNPQSVTQSEVDALDQSFTNSFKQLTSNFCDPFFRTPLEIVIDTTTVRSRLLQTGGSRRLEQYFQYQYAMQIQCRNCGENTRLFSESVTRMLSQTTPGYSAVSSRRFQEDNLCFCGLEAVDSRSPTTAEFTVSYNSTVSELNLPNIDQVLGVVELGRIVQGSTSPPKKSKIKGSMSRSVRVGGGRRN